MGLRPELSPCLRRHAKRKDRPRTRHAFLILCAKGGIIANST